MASSGIPVLLARSAPILMPHDVPGRLKFIPNWLLMEPSAPDPPPDELSGIAPAHVIPANWPTGSATPVGFVLTAKVWPRVLIGSRTCEPPAVRPVSR